MSVQGDLAEQNESSLQEQVVTDKSENEIIEGVVRDRNASCTTCTEKSEARLKELNFASLKTNEIRKSSREKRLTPKMQELKEQELAQKERKFKSAYENWKIHVRDVRSKLKHECSESDLCDMMDGVEKQEFDLKELYDNMRLHAVPSQEIRRKIDACSAVTADLVKLMRVRLVEDGMEFDAEAERARLRMLLDCEYARSIYGSTVSRATVLSNHSKPSLDSASISAKRAETAALLAAKKAEVEMEADIDAQRQQLKKLENRRDIEVMEARLRVYTEEESRVKSQQCRSACSDVSNPNKEVSNTLRLNQQVTKGEASVVQVLQESMALSRLPVPEPFVFFGDPLKFIEWSTTFKALIERQCPNPADKLFYLQKYIDGEARSVLEGSFYRKDEQAYQQAWEKLNARYGHSFVVQRAFREKLNKWTKIGASEYVKLREFSDFLQSCSDAMPHIKGLQVLNDCEENQKILVKLPNWVTSRWNRYVTEQLDQDKDYPSFSEFVSFISKEARIACNPVSSLYALKNPEEKPSREIKRSRVNTLATTVEDLDVACTMADSSNIIDSKIKESSKVKNTLVRGTSSVECWFCREGHSIHKCQKLMERTAEEKRKFVIENKLCFACLRKGHGSKDCENRAICAVCKKRHPTPLHEERWPGDELPSQIQSTSSLSCCINGGEGDITSMIVPVWLSSSNSESELLVYALLDTQSSHTFVDQEVCESLQALMEPVKLKLSTMMGKDSIVESQRVSGLKVRGFSSDCSLCLPAIYTRDFIPFERTHIPTCETAKRWRHLEVIADEMPARMDCAVGLLIGYNFSRALAPRQVITGGDEEPYAIKTDLGWSIIGGAPQCVSTKDGTGLCHRISVRELPPVTPVAVIRALELDFVDTQLGEKSISQDDVQFLQVLNEGVHQNNCGHLEMPLPFKARPYLPNNKKLALVRLKHLKRKLEKNPQFKWDYTLFMEGVFRDGDAELADEQPDVGNLWYIPHQGVYHPKKPNKIRVVFDCSAKYEGIALNDHLLTGPDLTNGLTGVLCRFRKHPIAVMCDIEKMFHRFHVTREDRDYLRFLWWANGDLDTEPREYRMKVHLFGASSSPGCANYGLKCLASMNESEYPSAASFIRNNFYVDDGLISLETVEETVKLVKEAQAVCVKGKLHLHKFISNNREVLEAINERDRAVEVKNVDFKHDHLPVQNVLGVRWDVESDAFTFNVVLNEKPATRRGILSVVASVYDPLGFLAPFIISGKKVLQEMCRKGIGWDEPLPTELRPRSESWLNDFPNLRKIQIPRCFTPPNIGKILRTELHHFSDASSKGYGQCSYIRLVSESKVHCALVMGKARVAPTKVVTIPRLELTAAVMSAAVSSMLKEELALKVDREYFWTDSQVVLGYISNEARRFHVFVANRVQRIRETTDPRQWYYINTGENPADYASRGLTIEELINSNWLTGPRFLWKKEIDAKRGILELSVGDPEVKAVQVLKTEAVMQVDFQQQLSRFSKWTTVVNVIARIQRLAKKVKISEPLSVEERRRASFTLVRLAQQDAFKEELHVLSQESGKLPCNHPLYQLDPFIQDGIMRVGGRLRKASVPFELRHPAILPKDSVIIRLILVHYHQKIQHQGRGQTLNELRVNGFWIIGGSKVVAQYIRQCVPCRRARRPLEQQRMADLPRDRTDPSPPFTYCGMDCFGPFYAKQGRKEYKRYGLLFTCLCSRAVHIEMLEDMTADAFINALRCFIAIRGAVRQIRSDQGTNFVGAKSELKNALKEMSKETVAAYLATQQCDLRLNAPSSSHAGGIWERQIRTVKSVMSSVLAQSAGRLNDASLRTFFYEAMSIVNNRPLTVDGLSDPIGLEPLTPNHLLTMKSSVPLPPPGTFVREDLYAKKRWRRVQYLCEQFWGRWRIEYLGNISLRQRWHIPRRNVQVGDVVIVKEGEALRNEWRMARVLKVCKDDDGLVRKATIQMGDRGLGRRGERLTKPSIVERPIQKLVILVSKG
ncbi:hypothetical protein M9458_050473 [Cirrhinus mrigala]|uniref:Integrase catalytic domain-containing protein n=1 Tax=Cirrhinus mrigala TaxID=683832 RepID=A0ABD0MW29_CIRMR